jgi:hypothetical protein
MADKEIKSVNDVKIGDFVKFEDRDKSGKFSYIGEVITVQEEKKFVAPLIEIETFEGVMGFTFPKEMKDDDDFVIRKSDNQHHPLFLTDTKPTGWSKFKKDPKKYIESKEASEIVVPVKTKKEKVFELVAANPKKNENALLKLAKKEIGGTDGQLLSYIKLALAKK